MTSRKSIRLKGITWDHSRGYVPMVATSQRFSETHPGVEILWEKRSLLDFGYLSIQQLAKTYDLLVIDHPFVGYAASHPVLLPLDDYISADFLSDQANNSVGKSHESYIYGGHLWALAIDAATPVSSWRADLMEQAGVSVPRNWEELLSLARRGMVGFPAIGSDSLMHFYMLCSNLGEDPLSREGVVVELEIGINALAQLRELVSLCPPEILDWDPIATYETITTGQQILYCPFAYGYSNYARRGYAPNVLNFGDLPTTGNQPKGRSTLGGAGLAISVSCQQREVAVDYALFVASPDCQRTAYVQSGGQPGHRSAWQDEEVNRTTNNYFHDTLATLDGAYLRARYSGAIDFQDQAARVVHEFLQKGGDPRLTLRRLEKVYQISKSRKNSKRNGITT